MSDETIDEGYERRKQHVADVRAEMDRRKDTIDEGYTRRKQRMNTSLKDALINKWCKHADDCDRGMRDPRIKIRANRIMYGELRLARLCAWDLANLMVQT